MIIQIVMNAKSAGEVLERRIFKMVSYKEIQVNVWKEYDYMPISKEEKDRLTRILIAELVEIAERFDGPVNVTITYEAKGNC
jgi:hypothetical protein